MINTLKETLVRHKRIIPVIVAIVAIAAYMIPAHVASAAVLGSGNVNQALSQSNFNIASNSGKYGGAFADNNFQANVADQSAFVKINSIGIVGPKHHSGDSVSGVVGSGNVDQSISQTNLNLATNTGDFGTASASNNFQFNHASNTADVAIRNSNHGGYKHHSGDSVSGVVGSGNVDQSISQTNANVASNDGASGTATADHNTQINDASNSATVKISSSNHGGYKHHSGDSVSGVVGSGNVKQHIDQTNANVASNTGDSGSASASNNIQINSAHNNADVTIKNKH